MFGGIFGQSTGQDIPLNPTVEKADQNVRVCPHLDSLARWKIQVATQWVLYPMPYTCIDIDLIGAAPGDV